MNTAQGTCTNMEHGFLFVFNENGIQFAENGYDPELGEYEGEPTRAYQTRTMY